MLIKIRLDSCPPWNSVGKKTTTQMTHTFLLLLVPWRNTCMVLWNLITEKFDLFGQIRKDFLEEVMLALTCEVYVKVNQARGMRNIPGRRNCLAKALWQGRQRENGGRKEGREVREERMRRRGEKSEWKFIGHIKGLISVLKRWKVIMSFKHKMT